MLIRYYSANTNDKRMSNYVFVFSILALVEDNSCYWLEPLFTISSYGHNALYKQNIHPYKIAMAVRRNSAQGTDPSSHSSSECQERSNYPRLKSNETAPTG